MKRPVNFLDKINYDSYFNIDDETFKLEENGLNVYYENIEWYRPNDGGFGNVDCIWVRPESGWDASNLLGNYVLLIKIDWGKMIGEIVKSPVGQGSDTIPNCNATFKFTITQVASFEAFIAMISQNITNNIDILNP